MPTEAGSENLHPRGTNLLLRVKAYLFADFLMYLLSERPILRVYVKSAARFLVRPAAHVSNR